MTTHGKKYNGQRRKQIGAGDRAERVRTYHYGRGTVTDHRTGQTAPLARVLNGDLDVLAWVPPRGK